MFKPVKNQISFPKSEAEILNFWEEEDIFKKSISNRSSQKPFVFYDGPPFATGLPHYGHLLASTIKDIIPRYYAMKGFKVERRFGWDCHGLPVEMEIQNKLNLKSNEEIIEYGVGKFNNACREIVSRYSSQWRSTINRLGRWVDFDNDYKTMNIDFMESVWWVFKSLYDKGLIYKGFKVLPYSWKAGTILSNFEANLNYQEVDDPSLTVKFRSQEKENEFFLAWTTTPWTLISNLALAVNPKLSYVKIKNKVNQEIYYLSSFAFQKLPNQENYEIIEKMAGEKLIGKKYFPLFDYVGKQIQLDDYPNCFTISSGEFVGEEEGVGIVHISPAYGEDDNALGQRQNLPHFDAVSREGEFIPLIDFIAGENIKQADKKIIKALKEKGLVFNHQTIKHSYPYCWRTDTPLIYKAIATWFVRVEAFKENLIENNQQINWLPEYIKNGRFGKWLENVKDWAISRNRFWGTPIPIWQSEDGEYLCYGDRESLSKDSGKEIEDLHKEHIDEIVIEKNGKTYRRIPEVLDCWFESGSMPYAHQHFPFENKNILESRFPADFISEGIDQTRGWFYTLLVISSGLFNKPSFKNVIVSGLILAEDGKKMSKRLKNYPDPNFVLDNYGADALRVYLISSNVIKAETLKFSEKGLKEITKNIMIPLWNALSFLTTYANMDKWEYREFSLKDLKHPLDRWFFSYKETLVKKVNEAMESYQLYYAIPPIIDFIEKLTNIYIRRSRKRYWKSEKDDDKNQAYFTLYTILKEFSVILAPFMPFIAEKIYQVLKVPEDLLSVHFKDYPIFEKENVDETLEKEMEFIGQIISLARALRLKHKIKIRQPLQELIVLSKNPAIAKVLEKYSSMIKEELNVKGIIFRDKEEDYVDYTAKVNFPLWGKKLGKDGQAINKKIMDLEKSKIASLLEEKKITLVLDQKEITLPLEAFEIRRISKEKFVVNSEKEISCVLNTIIDEKLILEGLAREVVNRIQKKRKDLDLEYNQKITITYNGNEKIKQAIEKNQDYITYETLAQEILPKDSLAAEEQVNEEYFGFEVDVI